MTYTLQEYLVQLHTGQWFGWTDSKNKVYANLVIHSDDTKPTEQECIDGVAALQAEYNANQYARDRATQYAPLADQLDMLWHAIDQGIDLKQSDFYTGNKAVKDANPKGG